MGENKRGILALIGFMASGKSTVGAILSRKLGMLMVDLDDAVREEAGMSVVEIFAAEGEKGFREREREALIEAVQVDGRVISCGGGVVLLEENIALLRERCRVFYLKISCEEAVKRLDAADGRPLLAGGGLEERTRSLMEERACAYLDAAHEVVEVDARTPEKITEEIVVRWLRYRSE